MTLELDILGGGILGGGEQSIGGGMGDVGDSEASLAILCLMGLLSRVSQSNLERILELLE